MRAAPQSAHWRCAGFLAPFQGAENSLELDPGAAQPAVACTWLPSARASGANSVKSRGAIQLIEKVATEALIIAQMIKWQLTNNKYALPSKRLPTRRSEDERCGDRHGKNKVQAVDKPPRRRSD